MNARPGSSPDLADLRRQLIDRRTELRQQLSNLTAEQRRAPEPLSADFAEQAIQRENDEVVDALHAGALSELHAVESAIGRIESSSYGRCTHCGTPIEVERLQALPQATRCSHCAAIK